MNRVENERWKILLVEDDQDDYWITNTLLADVRPGKYTLDWVDNYQEALEVCLQGRHDIFLIDYRLGKFDGLELVRELSRRNCSVPILFMTGQGSYNVDLEAMKAGAADYLVKHELNADSLERTIRYALERKAAQDALQKAHDELELRVRERTEQLRLLNARLETANKELRNQIIERQRVQEALSASEFRFRRLTETTSSAIWIVQDMEILYANPAAQRITGYSAEELFSMPFWKIAHPSYQNVLKTHGVTGQWMKHLAADIPTRYELKILTKDGQERWADITAGPFEYDGKPALIVTAFDITERDQAERELRQAKKELEDRVKSGTQELRQANQQLEQANNMLEQELRKREDERVQIAQELKSNFVHTLISEISEFNRMTASYPDENPLNNIDQLKKRVGKLAENLQSFCDDLLLPRE